MARVTRFLHMAPPETKQLYRRLMAAVDEEALHDLVARSGPAVLELPFPYVVVAARNRRRDRERSERRSVPTEPAALPEREAAPGWDPLEIALASDSLRRTLDALATMDDRDVLVVWLHAQDHSDVEIAEAWDALGLLPPSPSTESIRKRRERARAALRQLVGPA